MQSSTPASPPLRERPLDALAAAQAQAHARARWVDAAKGMGIVLVVIGHSLGGLLSAKLADRDSIWAVAYYLIYTFHMPLFFLLAGLFVRERMKKDPDGFVRHAFTRIAWPYLLWSVVQLLVIGALGSAVNIPTPIDPWRLVTLVWEPTSQFWFLQSLLLLHLLSRALVPRIGALAWLGIWLLARGVVEWVELPTVLASTGRNGLYYAFGLWAGPGLLRMAGELGRRGAERLATGAAAVWAVAALAALWSGQTHSSLAALPAAVAGATTVMAMSMLPRGTPGAWWLALGRASMAIFVLHVLFVAGTRIVLNKLLGVDEVLVIVLLATFVGIAGPLLLRQIAMRAGATRALGLG